MTVQGAEPTGAGASRNRDTLSVDFPDEDIRTILRNVADLFELNLVVPETLQGKTSIKLRDVTWRQIFEVVLTPVGYTFIEEGSIIKIVSQESLAQEPVNTEVFILNYARAAEVQPIVSSLVDTAAGGKIVVDARTNGLVITERPSRMGKIRPIIEQLDKATDQVMIESKFVEVTNRDVKNIGVNWASLSGVSLSAGALSHSFDRNRGQTFSSGGTSSTSNQNQSGDNSSNTTNNLSNAATASSSSTTATSGGSQTNSSSSTSTGGPGGGTTTTSTSTTTTGPTSSGTSTIGPNTSSTSNQVQSLLTNTAQSAANSAVSSLMDLTNTGGTNRLTTAVFSASDFNVIFSALKTQNETKIVSNPTVVTLNNTEAFINVGQEYPVPNYTYNQERGSFEVSGFTYKPIGIILKVTPQVNARGFIKLILEPEVSQRNGEATFGGASGAQIPIIATRKAKTQVSMKDGFTMGIGGLMTTNSTNGATRVPVLGEIPLLGRLFRSSSRDTETTNLLIFITAKSINAEGAGVGEIFDPRQIRSLNMQKSDLPGYRDGSDPFVPAASSEMPK